MTPQGLQALLGAAVNLRGMTGRELTAEQQDLTNQQRIKSTAQIAADKRVVEQAAVDATLAQNRRKANKKTLSAVRSAGGTDFQDISYGGNVVGQKILGESEPKYKPNVFETSAGELIEVPVGGEIPPGARLATKYTKELTPVQQIGLESDLAKYQSWIDLAIESKDKSKITNIAPYVEFFNKHSKTHQYKEIPEVVTGKFDFALDKDRTYELQPKLSKSGTPQTGDILDGYKFLGGDPGLETSWEKVK